MPKDNRGENKDGILRLLPPKFEIQTPDHQTLLTLQLVQDRSGGTYSLVGRLWDKTVAKPLQGMKIFFTADSPIKISNQTTNKLGVFKIATLTVPDTAGDFEIRSHFTKIGHYNGADSNTVTMKVDGSTIIKSLSLANPNSKNVD